MKFSVIIPTHNRSRELKRGLKSLVEQDFKDFEVIVCDDGSQDNTHLVIEEFKSFLDIKYYYEENWGGPARPRNIGVSHSKGEWLCFLDSDDWWNKDKLSELYSHIIKDNSFDVYYHSFSCGGKKIGSYKKRNRKTYFEDLLVNGNRIVNSSICVKKEKVELVNGYSENKNLIAVEDYDFILKLAKINSKFYFINKVLGHYELGETNISNNFFKQIKKIKNLLISYKSDTRVNLEKDALIYYMKGSFLYNLKRYRLATSFFLRACKYGSKEIKMKSFLKLLKSGLRY